MQGRAVRLLWVLVLLGLIAAVAGQLLIARATARDWSAQAGLEQGQRIVQMLEQAAALPPRRDALLQAAFEQQRLTSLELVGAAGEPLFRRVASPAEVDDPASGPYWLTPRSEVVELALPARPGVAAGRLRLQVSMADTVHMLWRHALQFAGLMSAAAVAVLVLGTWLLRASSHGAERPGSTLSSTGADSSLTIVYAEPSIQPSSSIQPSERRLRKLARMEGLLVAQASELDHLRRQAQSDPLTGLPNRRDALARLYVALEGEGAPAGAHLLLLRVRNLPAANRRVGYEVNDEILRAIAGALRAQVQSDETAICGRLNGSDFILMRSSRAGSARHTAQTLLDALQAPLRELDPQCGVAIGVVALQGRIDLTRALALADEGLASAESGEAFSIGEISDGPELVAFGDSVWQQRLAVALETDRAVLTNFVVCSRDGSVLHLDCPMHMRFDDQGEPEPASRWLPAAMRGSLSPQVDLHVLRLALEAIRADGQPRCINVSAQSAASGEFMAQATLELEFAGEAASRLWIDLPESLAVRRRELVLEAARRWRPLGVRLALEHAGEQLGHIEALDALGLDCVRIDSRFVCGLTGPDSGPARRHLQSVVSMVHCAGLSIAAEGVRLAGDLAVVWALGFDAATGPAVLKRGHSISPK